MTVLKAVGSYVLTFGLFFAFLVWFFDKPQEHDILIPVLTALFASATAGGIIKDDSFDEQERLVNALITAVVTSGIWVFLFYLNYRSNLADANKDDQILVAIFSVFDSWKVLMMAAITFFTTVSSSKKS